MALRANEDEKAIVNAFLRAGHPWLAFGTVVLRSGVRISVAMALILITLNQANSLPDLLKHLPGF